MPLRPVYLLFAFLVFAIAVSYASLPPKVQQYIFFARDHYSVASNAFENLSLSAKSYIVFDAESGEVLTQKKEHDVHETASIIKLLTADTALLSNAVDSSTTVSWRAVATEGRAGQLSAGEEYHIRELVFPLLLESSNDAAEAIAEHGGRKKFVAAMNATAKKLHMNNTIATDPAGLSRGDVSTADDFRILLLDLMNHQRHVLDITQLPSYIGSAHTWHNNDPVYAQSGFVGGKHGYTDTAGHTLAAVFNTHFVKSDMTRPIGIVLLNTKDIVGDVTKIRTEIARSVTFEHDAQ